MGVMVLGLALGYLVFRPTMPARRVVGEPVMATAQVNPAPRAPRPAVPDPARLAAIRAARDAASDREARILAIDEELRELPDTDPALAVNLAREIKLRREQVQELRERVLEADQGLLNAGVEAQPAADSQAQLNLEAEVAALNQQLTDAKLAENAQKQEIGTIAISTDQGFMASLYAELSRRSGIVNAIEHEIQDLFGARQSDLESEEAARVAELNSLRQDRNALVETYNEAVEGLNDANQRYGELRSTLDGSRKSAAALAAEKASLLKP